MRQVHDLLKVPCAVVWLVGMAASAYAPLAYAWGDEGHRIVALIAEAYLTPSVRARVQQLLAADESGLVSDPSIASEATWADRYRDSDRPERRARGRSLSNPSAHGDSASPMPPLTHYAQTYRWHFVDLDLERPDLERACFGRPQLPHGLPASIGPAEDCVVDKLNQFEAELAAPATSRAERLLALQFVLHLVGDLHQPLHACTDHDEGGNLKHVLDAQGIRASLHGYWDVELVRRLGVDPREVAAALMRRIRPADLRVWRGGRPEDWALESHEVARRIAYGRLPPSQYATRRHGRGSGQYLLSDDYVAAGVAAVATQLSRAGVRLAVLLNRSLQ